MRKLVCIIALVGLAACTKPTETEAGSEGAASRAVVDEIYAGFKAGDMDRVAGAMAADIVWNEAEGNPYADNNPYIGPETVMSGLFARLGGEWDHFAGIPMEFVTEGNRVIVFGRLPEPIKRQARQWTRPSFIHGR